MSNAPLGSVLGRLVLPGRSPEDRTLVERFVRDRDEAAFAELVARHGPMVLGVARRTVGGEQDAEDVFQASFLLLARRAGSLRNPASVGSWLHGVARRLAQRLRRQSAARRTHEAAAGSQRPGGMAAAWQDVSCCLDDALAGLPENYRVALVLCYLEGRTHAEIARQLGRPLGTVRSWVARGRELLRRRLTRRGVPLSADALGAVLVVSAATAPRVPPRLGGPLLKAAVAMAAGAVPASLVPARVAGLLEGGLTSVKLTLGVLLLAGALAAGGGLLAVGAGGGPGPRLATRARGWPAPPAKEDAPKAGRPLALPGHPHGSEFAAFVAGGKSLVTADIRGGVRVLDAQRGTVRRSLAGPACYGGALAPDGRALAVAGWRELVLFDLDTGRPRWKSLQQARTRGVVFTPDGKKVIAGDEAGLLRVWDAGTGKRLEEWHAPHPVVMQKVCCVALNPAGSTLAYGCVRSVAPRAGRISSAELITSASLRLRDLRTGREVELASYRGKQVLALDTACIVAVAFSPDGRWLSAAVAAREDGTHTVRLWDSSGREALCLEGAQKDVKALACSPDGRCLATLTWDGRLTVFEVVSGKRRHQFELGRLEMGSALVFSQDSRRVLGSGKGVWLCDLWVAQGQRTHAGPSLAELWADLAGADVARAGKAQAWLAGSPRAGVPFVEKQVRASAAAAEARAAKLLTELDDLEFAVRARAVEGLEGLGELALPRLRKALAGRPSAEVRRQAQRLLARLGLPLRSAEALRTARAVEALEHARATDALWRIVRTLPDSWAAEQARGALGQLER